MEDGHQRDGRTATDGLGHVLPTERQNVLWFGEALRALADVRQDADVLFRELAIQNKAAQRIPLPGRAVLGPLKEFFENSHLRITELIWNRSSG
jgi:hypothetical protein